MAACGMVPPDKLFSKCLQNFSIVYSYGISWKNTRRYSDQESILRRNYNTHTHQVPSHCRNLRMVTNVHIVSVMVDDSERSCKAALSTEHGNNRPTKELLVYHCSGCCAAFVLLLWEGSRQAPGKKWIHQLRQFKWQGEWCCFNTPLTTTTNTALGGQHKSSLNADITPHHTLLGLA